MVLIWEECGPLKLPLSFSLEKTPFLLCSSTEASFCLSIFFPLCLLISLHPTLVVRIAVTRPLLIDSNTAQCVRERWSTETNLTLMKRHSHTRRKPKSNMAATINIRQPERKKCQLPQSNVGRWVWSRFALDGWTRRLIDFPETPSKRRKKFSSLCATRWVSLAAECAVILQLKWNSCGRKTEEKKMRSSISRNDTFSLQRVNLQFIPESYSSEQIWSCAAAQAGNPRVWLPEESDATTGTGCETRQKLRFSRNSIWKMACRVSWWWRRGRRK